MGNVQYKNREEAFAQLDRLTGTWVDEDGGTTTYEWMDGRNFMLHKLDSGIEIIGYDEENGQLKTQFFAGHRDMLDNGGKPIKYIYTIDGDDFESALDDMPDRSGSFVGKLINNDTKLTGSWNWVQNGEKMGYSSVMTKQAK